jgi:tetratricopeptide (TPR) repeat protein
MWHHARSAVALAALAWLAATAAAQTSGVDLASRRGSFTPGELALLPEICKDIQGSPTYKGPRGDYWRSLIGDSLQHMHHYCRGARDMLFARTLSLPPEHKRLLWNRAANEMQYVIKASPPTMMLQPELWLRYGEAQLQLGNLPEAQAGFEQSRKLKPDYWPAYTQWADYLIQNKQNDEARALLEEGLKHAPDQPELVKRLASVGANR